MAKFFFPFTKRRLEDGSYLKEAKIPVIFVGLDDSIETMAYLDTGSTVSHLPLEFAEALGFDSKKAKKTTTKGVAGEEDATYFKVGLKIARKNQTAFIKDMPCLVFLNPKTRFTLLGLEPLFEMFDVSFRLFDNKIELKQRISKS